MTRTWAQVADRLVAEDEYLTVSGEKRTRLGPGFFLTHRTTYSRDDGAVVGRLTATVFHFVAATVSGAGPGWAELTVGAALTHGVHAEAVARVSTTPA